MNSSQSDNKENKFLYKKESFENEYEIINRVNFNEDLVSIYVDHSKEELQMQNSDDYYNYMKDKTNWGNLQNSFSTIKNNIKYNYFLNSNELKINDYEWVRIFDMLYSTQTDTEELKFDLSYIIWMSYRNGFSPITNEEGNKYKTDCGWGCMIRCAQMMLARAIFMMKNNDFGIINSIEKRLKKELDREKIFDILILFFDNNLSYSDITEYKNSFCIMSKKTSKDFVLIENQYNTTDMSNLTPAFSIQNICKKGIKHGKGAGKWFSDINMVNIINEINLEINPLKGLQIINFSESVIYESEIIKLCFKEKYCSCEETFSSIFDIFYCGNCLENGILFYNKLYEFTNPGIIYISLRLGLEKIEPKYFNSILLLFNIPNNLGFIGGKTNKAFYFIGKTDNNQIIYLDPHYNQTACSNITELGNSVNTYIPDKLFLIELEEMSPALTVGFFFRNLQEYIILLGSLIDFIKTESIFTLSNYPNHTQYNYNKIISNINIDGDFLLLNY